MNNQLAKPSTPEDEELERKRSELASLEEQLADRELELATLTAELSAFECEYMSVVGRRYSEIDSLKAKIAEEKYRREPTDETAKAERDTAREQARQSATAVDEAVDAGGGKFKATDELKKLFKKCATLFHPDKGTSPEDKERRHEFFKRLNDAYAKGDEAAILQLLAEWESSPESVSGDGVGSELVRAIRAIAAIRKRIDQIGIEIAEFEDVELFRLKTEVETAESDGRDLLAEMSDELDARIDRLRREFDDLHQTA